MATYSTLRVSAVRPSTNPVRPFANEDIPQIADLHRRVFGLADRTSPDLLELYRTYFTEVFLNNPCLEGPSQSFVYQERSGQITGFLAVIPRRMAFNGKAVQACITSQFIVDPTFRGFVGLKLLSAALAGPQDITIADESNAESRKVWEGLGGITSHLYSMRWTYPLRPCQFAIWLLKKKRFLTRLLGALQPAGRALDSLIAQILKFPFRPSAPKLLGLDVDSETLWACLSEAGRKQSIRPDYDHRSLKWLLQRAGQMRRQGRLHKVLVKTQSQDIAGWYLFYANPGEVSEVIQLYAKPRFAPDVLEHLFHHAWEQGSTALAGRMEPSMMQAFSDRHCIFHCGPQWVLVHSRKPELLHAFNGGNAGFSRFDGEWCLHFQ
jgi:hypothetical protein